MCYRPQFPLYTGPAPPGRLTPHAKAFFSIQSINSLVINAPALTPKEYVKAPITIAHTGCGKLT